MMKVRPVDARDVVVWAALRNRLRPEAAIVDLSRETVQFVTEPDKSLLAAAFVAEADDGTTLGFIELSVRALSAGCDTAPVPHVDGWFVTESARKTGVGRALIEAAEAWAVERGYTGLATPGS